MTIELRGQLASEIDKRLDIEGDPAVDDIIRVVMRKAGKPVGALFIRTEDIRSAIGGPSEDPEAVLQPIIGYAVGKGITMDNSNPGAHSVKFALEHLEYLEERVERLERRLQSIRDFVKGP